MPAPENLQTQTPGEAPTTTTPDPEYSAKHNGGGRYRIWATSTDDWFSDFVVSGEGAKDLAQAEADRLNAGGEPYFEPTATTVETPVTTATAVATQAAPKIPVLTPEGWLVPELPANGAVRE